MAIATEGKTAALWTNFFKSQWKNIIKNRNDRLAWGSTTNTNGLCKAHQLGELIEASYKAVYEGVLRWKKKEVEDEFRKIKTQNKNKITFIIGGANSGKTSFALELLNKAPKKVSKIYLATGEAFDEEMKEKIEHHKKERLGMDIQTLEEPWDLQKAWSEISSDSVVLLDCLTTWTTNLLFHHEKNGCPNHNPKTLSKQDLTLLVQKHLKGRNAF